MQPYLFPYIGYFQLIAACDRFVLHDDVQYIRQGWINRNYIIVHKQRHLFGFSVKRDDTSKNINERFYTDDFSTQAKKLLRNIDQSYSRAPHFTDVRALLTGVLESSERNVARFNLLSIREISRYIGIGTKLLVSSELAFDKSLAGEGRVVAINEEMGSTLYVNPIGGLKLYSKQTFRESGIGLSFLRPRFRPYRQSTAEFIPALSVIDLMMNCSREELSEMLGDYEIV